MTHAIEGLVVWRGDEQYEATRQSMLWNALKPDRYPEAIVSAAFEADVAAAVKLARSRGLQVAVRAGGEGLRRDVDPKGVFPSYLAPE